MAEISRDNEYHDKGIAFLYVFIEHVDQCLLEAGIEEPERRQPIVKNIVFGMGNFLDQYWMTVNDEKIFPLLCFTKAFLNVNTPIDAVSPVLAPNTSFAYHEYAMGCISAFYRGDPASKVESSSV